MGVFETTDNQSLLSCRCLEAFQNSRVFWTLFGRQTEHLVYKFLDDCELFFDAFKLRLTESYH